MLVSRAYVLIRTRSVVFESHLLKRFTDDQGALSMAMARCVGNGRIVG